MSVEQLAIVLHHSSATGTAKLVLIGIANHDGDGGAWPTVDTLARYANVSRQNVQKALARLEKLGEVRRMVQAGGDHNIADHRRPNRYQVMVNCPATCDRTRNHKTTHELVYDDPSTGASIPRPGLDSEAGGGLGSEAQTVLRTTTKTERDAVDPAGHEVLLRSRCMPPFKRHEFSVEGYCTHSCGVHRDGTVVDPMTGSVLLEAVNA